MHSPHLCEPTECWRHLQNAIKQQQIEGLLRQNDCLMQENQDLVKDKALLLQQSIELTERWQRAAGELLEMRSQVSHFSPTTTASWGAGLVALEDVCAPSACGHFNCMDSPESYLSAMRPIGFAYNAPQHRQLICCTGGRGV